MPAILIRIPSVLMFLSQGQRKVQVDGNTVREAINDLDKKYPGFCDKLYDADGNLYSYVNIFLGNINTKFISGLETKIDGQNEIRILPAIAGG